MKTMMRTRVRPIADNLARIGIVLALCITSALAAERHTILFHGERLEIIRPRRPPL
jgi:hypothetical protein